MQTYFQLQFRMLNRKMTDFGLHPVFGYLLLLVGFIGLSGYLFYKTEYAVYIYLLAAYAVLAQLSDPKRNEFLKTCFPKRTYLKIRLVENGCIAIPFIAFLAFQLLFVPVLITTGISFLLVFLNFKPQFNAAIPTPFSKRPFEFSVGFRTSWYLIGFAYLLAVIAASVGNFNLGVFSLVFVFLVSLAFYGNPEQEYFVWIYNLSPRKFLLKKITTAMICASLLSLPIIAILGVCFFDNFLILIIFQILGYFALTTMILAKYAAYPDTINVPQVFIIVLAIQVPIFLILIIPFFFLQSVKRLNHILE